MKNTFRRITAGLIVGVLGSLMLSSLANAKVAPPFTPFPPIPTYKRIIIKPYIGKVTLQRSFQPDITTWATMSQGCGTSITSNTNWSPLVANVTNDLSNGFNPAFLITKVGSYASGTGTPADMAACKILIPDNSVYATYVQGTNQYKFEVSAPGPVTPSTPGVSAVFDNTVNGKVVNPTTGNTNTQEITDNTSEYNFKKYEAKAIDQVNTTEISGGGMAAGIDSTSGINESSRINENIKGWDLTRQNK